MLSYQFVRHSVLCVLTAISISCAADPLASWNDGGTKKQIVNFVGDVSRRGSESYIPPAERIAVFDNDGTLWAEQPFYFQLAFASDRVKVLADQHPEWREKVPFASVLRGDLKTVLAGGEKSLGEIVKATHAGMTTDEFEAAVIGWLASARHPETKQPYTKMVYQPMLELLEYLRAHGFKTYIVSGGGVDFIRAFAEETYGIPPEQVIGSRGVYAFEMRSDGAHVVKLSELDLIDDGPGKPVGIQQMIGRRPVIAVGNSDGDLQMLEYATSGAGRRLGVIIHHTDAVREWKYDKSSHIGRLDQALIRAGEQRWIVVDMERDWRQIFPSDP